MDDNTKVSSLYSLYLKAAHVPPEGKNLTIFSARRAELHPRPGSNEVKQAIVLKFVNEIRQLVLNDGNASRMVDIGGDDFTGWAGLQIHLKPAKLNSTKSTIIISEATGTDGTKPAATPVKHGSDIHSVTGGNKPNEKEAVVKASDNGGSKPYRFPSQAAEKFYNEVQAATSGYFTSPYHLLNVLGGQWFNFGNKGLWDEKLDYATSHARKAREAEQPGLVGVETTAETKAYSED